MVQGVLVGLMALGAVTPTALPARLVHMSVTVGVWLGREDEGLERHHTWLGSLTRKCEDTLPPPV